MPVAVQIDDDAYAIAKAFAEEAHCSVAIAVSRLVVKSRFLTGNPDSTKPNSDVRFPLVKGTREITADQVARLQDDP